MAQSGTPLQAEADLASEMAEVVSAARAEMDRLIQIGELRADPLRHPIEALSVHLDALYKLYASLLANIGQAAKPPPAVFTEAQIDKLSQNLARGCNAWAGRQVRAANWRSAAIGVAALLIMFLVGAGVGVGIGFQLWRHPELTCQSERGGVACYYWKIPATEPVPPAPPADPQHSAVPANKMAPLKGKT